MLTADRLIATLDGLIDETLKGSPKQGRLRDVAGAAITGRMPLA